MSRKAHPDPDIEVAAPVCAQAAHRQSVLALWQPTAGWLEMLLQPYHHFPHPIGLPQHSRRTVGIVCKRQDVAVHGKRETVGHSVGARVRTACGILPDCNIV